MGTLIDTRTLAERLRDASLVVVDCQFTLSDPPAGERAYLTAHIPGAVYAHLDRDLSGPKTGSNGRHPLPTPAVAAETFARFGIDAARQVVVYDQDTGMYASRLWWMLRWLGHEKVAVLDGGLARWVAEGRATRAGVERNMARHFVANVRHDMLLSLPAVQDIVAGGPLPGWRLVDGRAAERYRGDVEPIDRVAGHIPGAVNVPYLTNLGDDGGFRAPADLARSYREAIHHTAPEHVVCYCGSGVTACHSVLAMEHAGLQGGKLYAGSWSEWSADASRPVERSEDRRERASGGPTSGDRNG